MRQNPVVKVVLMKRVFLGKRQTSFCAFALFCVLAVFVCGCQKKEPEGLEKTEPGKSGRFIGTEYSFNVDYSDSVRTGEAAYIAITFIENNDSGFVQPESGFVSLVHPDDYTVIEKASLFTVRQNPPVWFAQLPISGGTGPGNYSLEVHYTMHNKKDKKFSLPLVIDGKSSATEIPEDLPACVNDIVSGVYYDNKASEPFENGSPIVKAGFAGKVIFSSDDAESNRMVCISHMPGMVSVYSGLERIAVKTGQLLQSGDPVGLISGTYSKDSNCAFGVYVLGKPVSFDFYKNRKFF